MKANTEEWFREGDFREDVGRYMRRQRLTPEAVALWTDVSSGTVRNFLAGGMLSVRVAAALAELCDLSIDSYRLTQSQHDKVIDEVMGAKFIEERRQLAAEIEQINHNIKGMGHDTRSGNIDEAARGTRRLAPRERRFETAGNKTPSDHQPGDLGPGKGTQR